MLEFLNTDEYLDEISDYLGFIKCDGSDQKACEEVSVELMSKSEDLSLKDESRRRLSDLEDDVDDEEDVENSRMFQGPNIIKSLGVFLVLFVFIILLLFLLFCFRWCSSTKYSCFKCYMTVKNKIFYNLFLRFGLQSFLKFLIAAGSTLLLIDWQSKEGL